MPKQNIFLDPGSKIPKEYEQLIKQLFTEKDLTKLEKFGGRIQISITAPFTDRKAQKSKVAITDELLQQLISKPESAEQFIRHYTKKQLQELSVKLNLPLAKAWTSKVMLNSIIQFLKTPDQWKGIAGEKK